RGTTFQAVIDRMKDGSLTAKCLGLVTDREDRGCTEKAKAAGLPVTIVEKKEGESREQFDRRLNEAIAQLTKESRITNHDFFIAALGWMSILCPWFINQWKNRIINVHPALLPKYGGAGMYGDKVHQAVLDSGDKESGITIHLMDEGVDTGKILLQKTCPVLPGDTVVSLKERVQGLEKEWYPKVLQMIERGELNL
ncbi:MAG: phosphoribosylglycinamide formyltransferase, partial [Candidatus Peribacteraceae bacterium]|nr:phosphoribosylglycinamide formyltransferase [Candidatus Peribacteraceae bacterium]